MIVVVILLASTVSGFLMTTGDSLSEPSLEATETAEPAPWSHDPLLGLDDPRAGATDVRYRVYFEVGTLDPAEDSFGGLTVSVDTGSDMFSGTGPADVETFRLELTDGTEVEVSDSIDSWERESGGSEIEVELEGDDVDSVAVDDIAAIVVIFGGVDNPESPGTYDATVDLNDADETQSATIEIIEE